MHACEHHILVRVLRLKEPCQEAATCHCLALLLFIHFKVIHTLCVVFCFPLGLAFPGILKPSF